MKTNHRRQHKGKHQAGFNYGFLTSLSLMRHGCGPNYTGRRGARQAIAGKKAKDHRAARHAADRALLAELGDLHK